MQNKWDSQNYLEKQKLQRKSKDEANENVKYCLKGIIEKKVKYFINRNKRNFHIIISLQHSNYYSKFTL